MKSASRFLVIFALLVFCETAQAASCREWLKEFYRDYAGYIPFVAPKYFSYQVQITVYKKGQRQAVLKKSAETVQGVRFDEKNFISLSLPTTADEAGGNTKVSVDVTLLPGRAWLSAGEADVRVYLEKNRFRALLRQFSIAAILKGSKRSIEIPTEPRYILKIGTDWAPRSQIK